MAEKKKPDEPTQNDQQAQPGQPEAAQQPAVSIELDGKQIAQAPAVERKLDYAPKGGRYLVNGVLVDANGQPVKD